MFCGTLTICVKAKATKAYGSNFFQISIFFGVGGRGGNKCSYQTTVWKSTDCCPENSGSGVLYLPECCHQQTSGVSKLGMTKMGSFVLHTPSLFASEAGLSKQQPVGQIWPTFQSYPACVQLGGQQAWAGSSVIPCPACGKLAELQTAVSWLLSFRSLVMMWYCKC